MLTGVAFVVSWQLRSTSAGLIFCLTVVLAYRRKATAR
jgi:hypothetical protein